MHSSTTTLAIYALSAGLALCALAQVKDLPGNIGVRQVPTITWSISTLSTPTLTTTPGLKVRAVTTPSISLPTPTVDLAATLAKVTAVSGDFKACALRAAAEMGAEALAVDKAGLMDATIRGNFKLSAITLIACAKKAQSDMGNIIAPVFAEAISYSAERNATLFANPAALVTDTTVQVLPSIKQALSDCAAKFDKYAGDEIVPVKAMADEQVASIQTGLKAQYDDVATSCDCVRDDSNVFVRTLEVYQAFLMGLKF